MSQSFLQSIESLPYLYCDFVQRIQDVPVSTDRKATVSALEPHHRKAVESIGGKWETFSRAEQVHGGAIAEVLLPDDAGRVERNVDGLMTRCAGVGLGIYVADCGAIYLVDTKLKGIALLHSGKKGTEANILGEAIRLMQERWGSHSGDIKVVLAPCIRPPHYETDFAATIREQAIEAGVPEENYVDCGCCTGSDLESYYSYRIEKGNTGRMLAILGIRE